MENNPLIGQFFVNLTRARLHVDEDAAVDDFLQAGAVLGGFDHPSLVSLSIRFFPGLTAQAIAELPRAKENAAKVNLAQRRHARASVRASSATETRSTAQTTEGKSDSIGRSHPYRTKTPSLPSSGFIKSLGEKHLSMGTGSNTRSNVSPTGQDMGELAGDLGRQPNWAKGIRGIRTFQANYKPGTVTKGSVLWDPRVWEEEQEEKKRKAEEAERKAQESRRSVQRKMHFRKVIWKLVKGYSLGFLVC